MRRQFDIYDTHADLKIDSGPSDSLVQVLGQTVTGDAGRGFYTYNPLNSLPDSITNVRPTGFAVGAWERMATVLSPVIYYDNTGVIAPATKKWTKVVTPTTSSGFAIDISAAGFTTILSANAIAIKNSSTVTSCPNVTIKSISTTSLVVNLTEGNPNTTTILSVVVTVGAPLVFADLTGLTLSVEVTGY